MRSKKLTWVRDMAGDRIVAQDYEVASRLDQLGLTASELIGVVHQAVAAKALERRGRVTIYRVTASFVPQSKLDLTLEFVKYRNLRFSSIMRRWPVWGRIKGLGDSDGKSKTSA